MLEVRGEGFGEDLLTRRSSLISTAPVTIRANSCELHPVGFHFVAAESLNCFFNHWDGFHMDIVHPAAFMAADVVMIFRSSVETSLSACQVHLKDHPLRAQDFKVTVHSGNTNLGKSFANQVMEVLSRGMGCDLLEFLQYHPALFSHSAWRIRVHTVLPGTLSLLRCNINKLPHTGTPVKIFLVEIDMSIQVTVVRRERSGSTPVVLKQQKRPEGADRG